MSASAAAPAAPSESASRSARRPRPRRRWRVPWMNIRQNSGTRSRTRPLSMVASTTAPSAAPADRPRSAGDADAADHRGGERGELPARGEDHRDGPDPRRVEKSREPAEHPGDHVGEEHDALGAQAEIGARDRVGADARRSAARADRSAGSCRAAPPPRPPTMTSAGMPPRRMSTQAIIQRGSLLEVTSWPRA